MLIIYWAIIYERKSSSYLTPQLLGKRSIANKRSHHPMHAIQQCDSQSVSHMMGLSNTCKFIPTWIKVHGSGDSQFFQKRDSQLINSKFLVVKSYGLKANHCKNNNNNKEKEKEKEKEKQEKKEEKKEKKKKEKKKKKKKEGCSRF